MNNPVNSISSGPHSIPWGRQGPTQQPPGFYGVDDAATLPSNPLHISWQDGHFPASYINASNVLEYFANVYNPFYDRTCINEILKMQGHTMEDSVKHTGIEYTVINASEPLFVIRKQKIHSPTQVSPIADYYIIGGMAYQAPDLCSVVNSRLLSAMHSVKAAFNEANSYMRYHPSKGYWWEFKSQAAAKPTDAKESVEVRATAFQRTRVDALLADLAAQFPPPRLSDENVPTTDPQLAHAISEEAARSLLPNNEKSELSTEILVGDEQQRNRTNSNNNNNLTSAADLQRSSASGSSLLHQQQQQQQQQPFDSTEALIEKGEPPFKKLKTEPA